MLGQQFNSIPEGGTRHGLKVPDLKRSNRVTDQFFNSYQGLSREFVFLAPSPFDWPVRGDAVEP